MSVTTGSTYTYLAEIRRKLAETHPPHEHAEMLLICGRLMRVIGDTLSARVALSQALDLYQQLMNIEGVAWALIELAYCDRLTGNYAAAFVQLRQAHRTIRAYPNTSVGIRFEIAYLMGVALDDRTIRKRSVICLQYAERLAIASDREDLRALALARLCNVEAVLDDKLRDHYRVEAAILGERYGQLDVLVLALSRWPRQAGLAERRRAYDLAGAIGSAELIIEAGNSLANALRHNQQAHKAVEFARAVADRAAELGYLRLEALCQHNLGLIYKGLGHSAAAREPLMRAVALQRQIGSRRLVSSLAELGLIYLGISEYDLGLRCVREVYQIQMLRRNLKGMRNQARNIGIFHHRLNEYGKALRWYQRSRKLAIQYDGERGHSYSTGNLSSLYQAWARRSKGAMREKLLARALQSVDQALGRTGRMVLTVDGIIKTNLKGTTLHSYTVNLGRKGSILLDLDRPRDARPYLYHAYRLARRRQYLHRIPQRLLDLARAYAKLGRIERAIKIATVAIARTRDRGGSFSLAAISAYRGRAKLLRSIGDLASALTDYEAAIQFAQKAVALVQDENTGIQMVEDLEELCAIATQLAWHLNRPERAFELQEMGHAPIFRRILSGTVLHPPPSLAQHLLKQEATFLEQQSYLQSELIAGADDDQVGAPTEKLYTTLTEVQQYLSKLWDEIESLPGAAEYVQIRRAQSRTYAQICLDLTDSVAGS
jgi:tetratricopeptide (TPR) repeat protein